MMFENSWELGCELDQAHFKLYLTVGKKGTFKPIIKCVTLKLNTVIENAQHYHTAVQCYCVKYYVEGMRL